MGRAWRTLPNGQIEIQGIGIETISGAYLDRFLRNVQKWGALIDAQSARTGVPRAWIAAFIDQESAGNPTAESPAGAYGLMQIMPMWWRGHTKEQMSDPNTNATIGCDLLAAVRKSQKPGPDGMPDLVKVASAYNCGSDSASNEPRVRPGTTWGYCEDKGYIDAVIARSNTYIERFGAITPPSSSSMSVLMLLVAAWGLWKARVFA